MRNLTGIPAGTFVGKRILRNCGGFVLQPDFSSDGTVVMGCDVHACYIKSPTDDEFRCLVTAKTMPAGDVPGRLLGSTGCYAIAIAYNDSSRVYFTYNGYLYRYDDTTKTATRTALAQKTLVANGPTARIWSRKLAVDPGNKDVFLFGTMGDSVWASEDGGTSVTDLVVPNGFNNDENGMNKPFPHLVAVDPTSASGGTCQRWYYSLYLPTAVIGTVANPTLTVGNSFSINGTTVTLTGTTVASAMVNIKSAGIANITAGLSISNQLEIFNTLGASITLANVSGTPLASLGMTAGTTAATAGGIYESTTGPTGPYTKIANSPAAAVFMDCDQTGRLWVCGLSGTVKYYTHAAGSFSTVSGMPAHSYISVAVDPADSTHVLAIDLSGNLTQSHDNAASWSAWPTDTSTSPAKQVIRASTQAYLDTGPTHNWGGSGGCIRFNPAATNELWQAWGFGPLKCNPPSSTSTKLVWTEQAKGIDMLNTRALLFPPGGTPLAGFLDLGTWQLNDLQNCSNRPNIPHKSTDDWTLRYPVLVQPTDSLDRAADNPLWIVTQTSKGWSSIPRSNPHHGYSEDGGKNWTMFPTMPPNDPMGVMPYGGQMIVGLEGQIMFAWNDKQTIDRTKDGGATWDVPPFPGLPGNGNENGIGDWGDQFHKKSLCYDKIGRALYLYDYGPAADTSKAGIWKSTDFGDTWAQIHAESFPNGLYNVRLRCVPDRAGHLFLATGPSDGEWDSAMWSLVDNFDGTMTKTVCNTSTINDIAFCKAPEGLSVPTAMVFGLVGGQWGYHVSYDIVSNPGAATWTHLGYLGDWLDYPTVMEGSQDEFGTFGAGLTNSGILWITYDMKETAH